MALIQVRACDVCEATQGVATYDIRREPNGGSIDLCEACSAPVEALLARMTQPPAPAPRRTAAKAQAAPRKRASRKGIQVKTIEEIEASKS